MYIFLTDQTAWDTLILYQDSVELFIDIKYLFAIPIEFISAAVGQLDPPFNGVAPPAGVVVVVVVGVGVVVVVVPATELLL